MNWFTNCATIAEIKKEYHRLALKHHPDVNPNNPHATITMQAINNAYHVALAAADHQTTTGTDGETHTYYYNEAREQAVIDKLDETIAANMSAVTIELVGCWLWVHGDTRPHKTTLKKLGYHWHSKRDMWYFRTGKARRRYAKHASFNDLRELYGSSTYTGKSVSKPATLHA